MFPASSYQTIYLILVSLLSFAICRNYTNSGRRINSRIREGKLLREVVFVFLLSLFIGFRPISSVFVDMVNYADFYDTVSTMIFAFDWQAENIIFDNLIYLFASLGIKKELFFVVVSIIYFVCMYIACKRLFHNDAFLVYVVCLAAFSTFSYGVNGIKAGAAASVFMLAIAYHDKIIPSLLLALVSYGFHHSMQVVIVAWIIVLFYHDSRVFLILWLLCVLLAALHVTFFQELFASLTDETGSAYLSNTDSSTQSFSLSGFRLDFILYSSIPIIIGGYLILKHIILPKEYHLLLSLYLLTNSVWLLCMYAEFTNRIAYLSWFIYPIVLIYPFLTFLRGKHPIIPMKLVIYGHLLFTIFMAFIYY